MSPLLIKISKDFATLWTTIDPIGNVALFAGLTAWLSPSGGHSTAVEGLFFATLLLTGAWALGQVVLGAIRIYLDLVKVGGGIIFFLFGGEVVFGKIG